MKRTILFFCIFLSTIVGARNVNPYKPDASVAPQRKGMKLVFSDEFNKEGKPDPANWGNETGFKRNEELQWYQADNANCTKGRLLIEGRKANFPNPNYEAGSKHWYTNRKTVKYTSSSINTSGKQAWTFGRFEVRARIDTAMGSWPAIWTLGVNYEWPACGEIDMLEFYRPGNVPSILANVASGTSKRWKAKWDGSEKPLSTFLQMDKDWVKKYHVWCMDWTKDSINLYVDDMLLNTTLLSETVNPDGTSPFLQPQYMLLNLALGGVNGGDPSKSHFPVTFEVDYVRIYQKTTSEK